MQAKRISLVQRGTVMPCCNKIKRNWVHVITLTFLGLAFLSNNASAQSASFTAGSTAVCESGSVGFTDTSTGATSWAWMTSAGQSSTLQNPSFLFAALGQYTVTLTINGGCGGDPGCTATEIIDVYPIPVVNDFTTPQTTGCAPFTLTFTADASSATPLVQYVWNPADGSGDAITTGPTFTHTYTNGGTYSPQVYVIDSVGCSSVTPPNGEVFVKLDYITVENTPQAGFSVDAPIGCTVPHTVNFTDESMFVGLGVTGTISEWSWDFGDGNTSTVQNPTHVYNDFGVYDATLIVNESSCPDTITVTGAVTLNKNIAGFEGLTQACQGVPFNFTDTSSTGAVGWEWAFGDGGTSSAQNPTYSYSATGTYTVSLLTTFADGCSDKAISTDFVTVVESPIPSFSSDLTTACEVPFPVTFSNTSTGAAGTSFLWNFGDGSTSTDENPVYSYSSPGLYTVSLEVTSSDGCDETIQIANYIQIIEPVADFSAMPLQGCIPLPVTFNDLSTSVEPIVQWDWTFGDGTTATETTPGTSHTYAADGTYDVSLTITNSSGCTSTISKPSFIEAGSPPVADFSVTQLDFCRSTGVEFTNLSTNFDTLSWNFGDMSGMSSDNNPSYEYSEAGDYSVTLTLWNKGCPAGVTYTDIIHINEPVAVFTPSTTALCDFPETIDFTDASTGAVNYLWDFGDGNTSTLASPSNEYQNPGDYTVTLTVDNPAEGCTDETSTVVHVSRTKPDFTSDLTTGCHPLTINFDSSPTTTTGSIASYLWDFGDGNSSAEANPSHTYTTPALYTVTLTVTEQWGCEETILKTEYIDTRGPLVDFTMSSPSICLDVQSDVTFSETSGGTDNNASWDWDFGDGNTGSGQTVIHNYSAPGIYNVNLTVTDTLNCSDNLAKQFVVSQPIADFTTDKTIYCAGEEVSFINNSTSPGTNSNLTYIWDFGDGTTSTDASPVHSYPEGVDSMYTVILRVTDTDYNCTRQFTATVDNVVPMADFIINGPSAGCAPFSANFEDNSSSDIVGWLWTFQNTQLPNNSALSFAQNPSVSLPFPGNYDVTLVVQSVTGCLDTISKVSFVEARGGYAEFSFEPDSGCIPHPVMFDIDILLGDITSIVWNFGDGVSEGTQAMSAPQMTTHTYTAIGANQGLYRPGVTVYDINGCEITYLGDTVYVSTDPVANFNALDTILCVNEDGTFNNSSVDGFHPINSWEWDFGNGETSNLENPDPVNYPVAGQYDTELIVETTFGCRDTILRPMYMDVNDPEIFAGIVPSDTIVCPTAGITFSDMSFTNLPGGVEGWVWDFGDGSPISSEQNPTHSYANPGMYIVTLVSTDSICTDTAMTTVEVLSTTANFSANPSSGVRELLVDFTDLSISDTTIVAWSWDFGNGQTSILQHPTDIFYENIGVYDVILTVTNEIGCMATITQQVTVLNNPPTAIDDINNTQVNTAVNGFLLTNDSDLDGHGLIINPMPVSPASNGMVTINPDGSYTYMPAPGFTGTDTFSYEVCDNYGPDPQCSIATVTIHVFADGIANDPPIPNPDHAQTFEGVPVPGSLISNDIDPDGDALTITPIPVTNPVNGMVTINPDGTYLYTPNPGFVGVDQFTYEVCDPSGLCETTTATITVLQDQNDVANDPPFAADDAVATDKNTTVAGNLAPNDFDPNGHGVVFSPTPVSGISNGMLTINTDGTFNYTPNPDFSGTDQFIYEVCDDQVPPLCDTATVYINVINDSPIATFDTETTLEDTPVVIDILGNDLDPDGLIDSTTVNTTGLLAPSNGTILINPVTGQITYSPNMDWYGTDTFEYEVCDNGMPVLCDTALVTVVVEPVNDPPVVNYNSNSTNEDTPISWSITANDTDVDANIDPMTIDLDPNTPGPQLMVDLPGEGIYTVDPNTGILTFDPVENFNGPVTQIQYEVCDDGFPLPSLCDTALVDLTVNAINDLPVAVNDTSSTSEDTPVTFSLTGNDSDLEGNIDPATIDLDPSTTGQQTTFTLAGQGTYVADLGTGEVTFTPAANFNGTVTTVPYSVCDDGIPLPAQCAQANIFMEVTPVNDPPLANYNSNLTNEDTPVSWNILTNDSDIDGNIDPMTIDLDPMVPGQQLTFDLPNEGTYSVDPNTGILTFDPVENFNGAVTQIQYEVCDDGTPLPSLCDTALIDMTVLPINDPPVANYDSTGTIEEIPVTFSLTGNDSDLDGNIDPLTIDLDPVAPGQQTMLTIPGQGTYTVNTSNGEVTFEPVVGFIGMVNTVTYQVCDDGTPLPPQCTTADIDVTVNPANEPPVAVNDTLIIDEDMMGTINIMTNDSDPNGVVDTSTIDLDLTMPGQQLTLTLPGEGTFAVDTTTGNVTFTPFMDFYGPVTPIPYEVCDDGPPPVFCDTADIYVFINAINDPPVAMDDSDTTPEDTPVTFSITGNDDDPLDPAGDIDRSTIDLDPSTSGQQTTYTVAGQGTYVANLITGEVTFTPVAQFNGTVTTVPYSVCDDGNPLPSLCAQANIDMVVTPVNDPPVATDDSDTTPEDTPITFSITGNDDDPLDPAGNIDPSTIDLDPLTPGQQTTFTVAGQGTYVADLGTGEVTFTPVLNFNGTVTTVPYSVCDDGNPLPPLCAQANIDMEIIPVNDPPVAGDDSATTDEDTPVTFNIITPNDTDVDGNVDPGTIDLDPLTPGIQTTFAAPEGTFEVDPATGDVTYTPEGDALENFVTITYEVCDDGTPLPSLCTTADITIEIIHLNDPLVAVNDTSSTMEDTPVTFNLSGNDSDVDGNVDNGSIDLDPNTPGQQTTFTIPGEGTYEANLITGDVTFTPEPDFNGNVTTIPYSICDDGFPLPVECAQADIYMTISPVNDALTVVNDTSSTLEDTPVTFNIIANDSDIDGNVNPFTIDLNPSLLGQQTTLILPGEGTYSLDLATGNLTFTPLPGFSGDVTTIPYRVCDTGTPFPSLCDVADIYMTVEAVNDPPVANDDSEVTPEDTPVTFSITANDSDTDGNIDPATIDLDPLTPGQQTTLTLPGQGEYVINTSNGDITFTPEPNFNGPVTQITYEVCDDGTPTPVECVQANIDVTVDPVNDTPVADDESATTDEDTPVTINVTDGDDFGGDGPSTGTITLPDPFNGLLQPANGSVTLDDGGTPTDPTDDQIVYTPNADYNGPDSFEYQICDADGDCATATVDVTIDPVNDPPVAVDDNYTTNEDTPIALTPLDLDSDLDGDALSIVSINGTALTPGTPQTITVPNGTVTTDAAGVITFTPDANFTGMVTFPYVITDGTATATANEIITIDPVNDPPVAVDDTYTTDEDTPVALTPLDLDSDLDGDALSIVSINGTALTPGTPQSITVPNGTVTTDAAGVITFTPDANFTGMVTFPYVITDGTATATANEIITIDPVNDPPVAVDDTYTTDEDTPVALTPLDLDSDLDGDALSIVSINGTALTPGTPQSITVPNGTVTTDAAGIITFTPDANFTGMLTFPYVITDGTATATANEIITIDPVNDPPVAVDDTYTTDEDTPVALTPLDLDSDLDGDALSIVSINGTALTPGTPQSITVPNGTVITDAAGIITFTPDANFTGMVTFPYVITDGTATATANEIITIDPVNDPPVAVDDTYTTDEDTPVALTPLDLDSDLDGDALSIVSINGTALTPGTPQTITVPNGTVTTDAAGVITFTPDANFTGMVTFPYVITDGTATATANEIITIDPVNDPPVAVDDTYTTDEDTPVALTPLDLDSDLDGDALSIVSINGTALTPGTPQTITVPNGTVTTDAAGAITFTPDANFTGMVTFPYVITDGTATATANEIITIDPVNDPPVAVDDTYTTDEDTPVALTPLDLDSDLDGDALSIVSINGTALTPGTPQTITVPNGTVTTDAAGVITFTPDANFTGMITFPYVITDGTATATANEIITIDPVNDPPVAVDDTYTTDEDTPVALTPLDLDSDLDGDALSIVSINGTTLTPGTPQTITVPNGTVTTDAAGEITFTPDANFTGMVTFPYVITDGTATATANEIITIDPVNDPPVAVDDTYTTDEDTPVALTPLDLDSDLDGDALSIVSINGTALTPGTPQTITVPNGTVTTDAAGVITFTPDANFTGMITFPYVITDGTATATANEIITIDPVNDPPVAVDDTYTTDEDTPVALTPLDLDSDLDGDALSIVSINGTALTPGTPQTITVPNGTVTTDAAGVITFTPDANFTGMVSFPYVITDGTATATANEIITIDPVNDPPVAVDDTYTTDEDTPVALTPLDLDSDLDGDALSIVSINGTALTPGTPQTITVPNGTVTTDAAGIITFTPDANFTGMVTFPYVITDGTATATANEIITIDPVNHPPVATDNSGTTPQDTPFNGPSVLTDDSDPDGNPITINPIPVTDPLNGMVTINGDGTYVYTPAMGFAGVDSFMYEICDVTTIDPQPLCDTATVVITIVPNITVAINDDNNTLIDTDVSGNVMTNDLDPEGDNLIFQGFIDPLTGMTASPTQPVTITGVGTIFPDGMGGYTFDPDATYVGQVDYQYVICDDGVPVACDTALLTITISPLLSTAPVDNSIIANNDENLSYGQPVSGNVLSNDSDPEGNALIFMGFDDGSTPVMYVNGGSLTTLDGVDINGNTVSNPGTLVISPDGSYTFTPVSGFEGTVTVPYQICDDVPSPNTACTEAILVIKVIPDVNGPLNDPPFAGDDSEVTNAGVPVFGDLLANDSDPNGDPLTVDVNPVTDPANGTLAINPDGTYTYKPNPGYTGPDQFVYSICDNGTPPLCSEATVYINVFFLPNLSIECAAFEAEVVDKEVILRWITETESNNKAFEIELSYDGLNFFKIGEVEGQGESDQATNYEFVDRENVIPNITLYYRLKQINFDGSFEYVCQVVTARVLHEGGNEILSISPNPTSDFTEVLINLDSPVSDLKISVFDLLGRELQSRVMDLHEGFSQLHIDLSQYAAGTYLIIIESGYGLRLTEKVVKAN